MIKEEYIDKERKKMERKIRKTTKVRLKIKIGSGRNEERKDEENNYGMD